MPYTSRREKILNFMKNVVIPTIKKNKDVGCKKLISYICIEFFCSVKVAEECLAQFIEQGIIKREKECLTIPDGEIINFVKNLKEEENQVNAELREAGIQNG